MIIPNIIIYFFVLIINYKIINAANAAGGEHYNKDKDVRVLPMKKLKRNLELICDTSDNFVSNADA